MFCAKCGGESVFKSGFVKGEQCYKCKGCGRQFVPTRHHGKTQTEKLTAILLYINGLSLRTIARLMHVTAIAVLKWFRQYALESYGKPKPQTNTAVVIVLDEVWHYLKRKKRRFWIWMAYWRSTLGFLTGNVGLAIVGLFSGCFVGYSDGM